MQQAKSVLLFFILILFITVLSSCYGDKIGVWEHHRTSENIYVCYPEDDDYVIATSDRVYHTDKSCKDLGYTESGSSVGSWHFVSPSGENVPGKYGVFWDDYNANGGGSGGGGSASCDMSNYNGPEFNIQVDSQCKTAYLYDCQGMYSERDVACDLYYQWESSWQGSGSFPKCPYCN